MISAKHKSHRINVVYDDDDDYDCDDDDDDDVEYDYDYDDYDYDDYDDYDYDDYDYEAIQNTLHGQGTFILFGFIVLWLSANPSSFSLELKSNSVKCRCLQAIK